MEYKLEAYFDEYSGFFLDLKNHPYFHGKEVPALTLYDEIPNTIDWDCPKSINLSFPQTWSHSGSRSVPMGPVLDAISPQDKLQVVNWWRSLTKAEQTREAVELKTFYRAYTTSNDKIDNERQRNIKRQLEENPKTAGIAKKMKPGEFFVPGMADSADVRKIAAANTASHKVVEQNVKQYRGKNKPPTDALQLYDKTTRNTIETAQKATEAVNIVAGKPDGASFPGEVLSISSVYRTTTTPLKNGKLPKDKVLRDKPIMELYGAWPEHHIRGVQQMCIENNEDFKHIPHGQKPPMTAFKESRKNRKYKSREEQRRIDYQDVRDGKCSMVRSKRRTLQFTPVTSP